MLREDRAITSAEEGDLDFESFFGGQYPMLVGALYLLTGDQAEAEDLAQEALARAYERWDRVREMDSPGGYVYRTAVNLNRKRARRAAIGMRLRLQQSSPDPVAYVESRRDVMKALADLPVGQREALVLTEWLDLTADEAGAILGIEGASVRSRVHRAKRVLRTRLDVSDA